MVSVFPSLLAWSELSPLLIRLTLAAVLIYWASSAFKNAGAQSQEKIIAGIEGIVSILLIIGLWTQVAALVALIDLLIRVIGKIRQKAFLTDGINYYLILLILAISILVTGPGALSIDLPL